MLSDISFLAIFSHLLALWASGRDQRANYINRSFACLSILERFVWGKKLAYFLIDPFLIFRFIWKRRPNTLYRSKALKSWWKFAGVSTNSWPTAFHQTSSSSDFSGELGHTYLDLAHSFPGPKSTFRFSQFFNVWIHVLKAVGRQAFYLDLFQQLLPTQIWRNLEFLNISSSFRKRFIPNYVRNCTHLFS